MSIELEHLNLKRAVIEVFGGCNYTCQMCPQGSDEGREKEFLKKMPLKQFENILDQITPKYGHPVINLEGSGEPTMAKDLHKYIAACTKRGLKSYLYCNGAKFTGQYMKDCIDAGLSLIRFSVIGYNRELYQKWMSKDNFDLIKSNAIEAIAYVKEVDSKCTVQSYHLILDPENAEFEAQQYKDNFITPIGTIAYIWKMHNWSGNHSPEYGRTGKKRSCGRPGAPELTVRAGGAKGQSAAVTPCCQVLGPPNESKSILGHLSSQTFEEIWTGDLYTELRNKHNTGDFESISYCKGCDFLQEDTDVLHWSNSPSAKVGQPIGTELTMQS
jgi:MoaA/NifB/PqqE/SkfB family radical SAM enzyme